MGGADGLRVDTAALEATAALLERLAGLPVATPASDLPSAVGHAALARGAVTFLGAHAVAARGAGEDLAGLAAAFRRVADAFASTDAHLATALAGPVAL
ncbi:hypothetical protein [Cellulomonas endophytica]|uniref:hypothetical protein n=1 Tax=Cellulomonas endophytica TaxID=2494735 RepID=UPI0010124C9A|nr:hypothetical protein [Cellulomonas endophytica]